MNERQRFMNMLIDRDQQDNSAFVPMEGRVCYVNEEQLKAFGPRMMGYDLKLYQKGGDFVVTRSEDGTITIKPN